LTRLISTSDFLAEFAFEGPVLGENRLSDELQIHYRKALSRKSA
jgi:hypothetical protein